MKILCLLPWIMNACYLALRIIIEYIMIASLVINPRTGKIKAERKNGRNEVFKAYDIVLGIENLMVT